jgi:starch synthase
MILVVLGSGQREYEDLFRRLNKQYPQKIAVKIAYDNAMAHKIEAGSDLYLMPSHYEPCGLNQIYSLKYGTVPVVRATGGLDDTVEQFDPKTGKGTGFKFREYTGEAMLAALRSAVALYHEDRSAWRTLMLNGMAQDYSWSNSAKEYVKVYERARQVKQQGTNG